MRYRNRADRRVGLPPFPSLEPLVPYTVDSSAGGNFIDIDFAQAMVFTGTPLVRWATGSGFLATLISSTVLSSSSMRLTFATNVADALGFFAFVPNQSVLRSISGGYADPLFRFVPLAS